MFWIFDLWWLRFSVFFRLVGVCNLLEILVLSIDFLIVVVIVLVSFNDARADSCLIIVVEITVGVLTSISASWLPDDLLSVGNMILICWGRFDFNRVGSLLASVLLSYSWVLIWHVDRYWLIHDMRWDQTNLGILVRHSLMSILFTALSDRLNVLLMWIHHLLDRIFPVDLHCASYSPTTVLFLDVRRNNVWAEYFGLLRLQIGCILLFRLILQLWRRFSEHACVLLSYFFIRFLLFYILGSICHIKRRFLPDGDRWGLILAVLCRFSVLRR